MRKRCEKLDAVDLVVVSLLYTIFGRARRPTCHISKECCILDIVCTICTVCGMHDPSLEFVHLGRVDDSHDGADLNRGLNRRPEGRK